MGIKYITIEELLNSVWEVLNGEWELGGSTSSSFTLYHDLLDDDYISIDVFKNSSEKIDVYITFDYSDFYHHELRTFGNIDELVSWVKKANNLNLDAVKLELETTFSNYVHKVLK